jgi:hypothetical protein
MNDGSLLRLGPYRGAVHPDFDTPEFRTALADIHGLIASPSARVLLDSRNLVVAVSMPVSASVRRTAVVKEFRPSGFKKLKTLAVPGKANKAWRGAMACLARGVRTPHPMAWLERRENGIVAESWFVAASEPDVVEIRSLFRVPASADLDHLLAGLAEFLKACHDKGIVHRDLSDGNVLVRRSPDGAREFWLIDTNRIRVRRRVSAPARIRNLVRLGVPPGRRDFFLDRYLGGERKRRALRLWYAWAKAWYAWTVALKKKLRLKRLAEWLRIQ